MAKKKTAVGRPSELTQELKDKALAYLLGGYIEVGDVVPTIEGLACYLGKSRSRIYIYREQDEEFKDTLDSVLTVQGKLLINGGLKGDYNPTITKLMLTNHGYSDKQETTVNGDMNVKVEATPINSIFEK